MSRPRKDDAMTTAERVRAFRLRQKAVTKTDVLVTKTFPDGSFCEWFPWAKGCSLDLLGRTTFNVITPSHPRFHCQGDSCHPAWWAKS